MLCDDPLDVQLPLKAPRRRSVSTQEQGPWSPWAVQKQDWKGLGNTRGFSVLPDKLGPTLHTGHS